MNTAHFLSAGVPDVTAEGPTLVKVRLGEAMSLSCWFVGEPPPNITWSLGGSIVEREADITTTSNRSELTVQEMRSEHGGVYVFTASNSIGSSRLEFTVQS